jgi:hypothetical protein
MNNIFFFTFVDGTYFTKSLGVLLLKVMDLEVNFR